MDCAWMNRAFPCSGDFGFSGILEEKNSKLFVLITISAYICHHNIITNYLKKQI